MAVTMVDDCYACLASPCWNTNPKIRGTNHYPRKQPLSPRWNAVKPIIMLDRGFGGRLGSKTPFPKPKTGDAYLEEQSE